MSKSVDRVSRGDRRPGPRASLLLGASLLAFAAASPSLVSAQTWEGTNNTSFADGTNWAGGQSAYDTNGIANIPGAVPFNPVASTSGSVSGLIVGLGGSLSIGGASTMTNTGDTTINGGTITIFAGSSLVNATAVQVNALGLLSNSGTVAGAVEVSVGGAFQNGFGGVVGAVTNSGSSINAPTGTVASLTNQTGSFFNSGTITGTVVVNGGTVTNDFTGIVSGSSTVNGGTLNNDGSLAAVSVAAGGTFNNFAGATAGAVTNAGTGLNSGTATIASLSQSSGTFTNSGSITTTLTMTGGTVTNTGSVGGLSTVDGGTLSNSGGLHNVNVGAGGTFNNNAGGVASTVTNAGTGSNASGGSITILNNTGGTFSNTGTIIFLNVSGGTVTNAAPGSVGGLSDVSGGTLNNTGTLAAVNVGAAGTFNNNAGGTATNVTSAGTSANAGNISGLLNVTAGTFNNQATGVVGGLSTITGGTLTNAGSLAAVDVGAAGTFNNSGTAGAVTNAGAMSSTGTLASLANTGTASLTGGTITGLVNNGAGGSITANGTVTGDVTNAGMFNAQSVTTGAFTNSGSLNLAQSAVGNTSTVAAYTGAGGSIEVRADIASGSTSADRLIVTGGGGGNSVVNITNINNATRGFFAAPLVLVEGGGGTTFTATGVAAPNGLVTYEFRQEGADWVYASNLNAGTAVTIATSIASVVSSLGTAFHQPASALVSRPDDPSVNQMGGGLFVRPSGGGLNMRSNGVATLSGGGVSVPGLARPTMTFGGVQAGADWGVYNINGTGWNFSLGLMGGYVHLSARERDTATSASLDIPYVGLYSVISREAFTAEVSIRRDFIGGRVNQATLQGGMQQVSASNTNIGTSVSYRFMMSQGWFIEPSASLAYSMLDVRRFTFNGGSTLDFSRSTSLLGRVGATVGTTIVPNDRIALQPFVTAAVWREMLGANQATYTLGADTFSLSTDRVGTFYQVGVGVSGRLLQTNLLGFVRGDVRFGERMSGYSVNAGARLQF